MFRLLILNQAISDPNYDIIFPKGVRKLKFAKLPKNMPKEEKMARRRYSMIILDDPSGVFKNLPCHHDKWESKYDNVETTIKQVIFLS